METYRDDGQILAIVIRHDYRAEGIEFFTPTEFSQQLAYMNRPEGYQIDPHVHNTVSRNVNLTQEVLFIRSGRVQVDLYNNEQVFIQSIEVSAGDVILLAHGGHGFTMLEDAEIIEVKQGPYAGDQDKTTFAKISETDGDSSE